MCTFTRSIAIGVVLLQELEEWHPLAYISRKLTDAERNYAITERETFVVVVALNSLRLYLFKDFDLFTDNQALLY